MKNPNKWMNSVNENGIAFAEKEEISDIEQIEVSTKNTNELYQY